MVKSVHLTLLMGPVVPVPVPRQVTEALSSVQVTISSGQRSGFQLSFAVSKASLISQVLLPAGAFDPGIRVIIIATIGGLPNVLMDGIIIRQEFTPSNEIGGSTLTVTGEDVSLLMDLVEMTGLPFPAMSVELRVAAIIAKYALFGLIPVVVPTLFPDLPLPTKEIPFEKGTDLAYLNQLAKENGYVFYVSAGPVPGTNIAYWGPEVRIGVPQPALNINMDAHTNVESLSFSFDGSSREQLVVIIQEPITKLPIPIPIPDISLLSPPLALRQAPALKIKFLDEAAKLNPIQAIARGLGKVSESADAVSGSGQLDVLRYGRLLSARGLVGVRGAGIAYDGLYYVKSVTHNLNVRTHDYKQSFTLARNGLIPLGPVVVP
jgi:hypothetical protein